MPAVREIATRLANTIPRVACLLARHADLQLIANRLKRVSNSVRSQVLDAEAEAEAETALAFH